jgi:hypothetical protein
MCGLSAGGLKVLQKAFGFIRHATVSASRGTGHA